jgi:hypothetical protein
MVDQHGKDKRPAGGDLVIPLLAGGFATYYIASVWNLPWEAKASGLVLGGLLLTLVTVFVLKIAYSLFRGTVSLSLRRLVEPLEFHGRRLGLVALMIAFIVALPYLGFTLTIFTFLLLAMLVLGVRSARRLFSVAGITAGVGYLIFIALLNTPFPHGPVEKLVGSIFS